MKLSHTFYLWKVVSKFSMDNVMDVNVPTDGHFKLFNEQCTSIDT